MTPAALLLLPVMMVVALVMMVVALAGKTVVYLIIAIHDVSDHAALKRERLSCPTQGRWCWPTMMAVATTRSLFQGIILLHHCSQSKYWFINDYRHHGCRQRHANVQLKQAWSRHTGACFIGVFAKLDIGIGEELLMDYGKHYWQLQRRKRHLGLPKAVIPIPSKDKAERYLANEEEGGDTKSRMVTQKGERKSSNDEHITLLSSTPSSSLSPHRPRPPPPRGGILEGFGVEVFGSGDQTPLYTPKQQEKIQRNVESDLCACLEELIMAIITIQLKDFTGIKDDVHAAILLKDKKWDIMKAINYFHSQEEFYLYSENEAKRDKALLEDVKARSMEGRVE
eukprot:jgi/Bigna1/78822/fgenesh1_pg.57_\